VGAALTHTDKGTDGRTDVSDEVNRRFRDYANALKKKFCLNIKLFAFSTVFEDRYLCSHT
jgi:hypothetical protein